MNVPLFIQVNLVILFTFILKLFVSGIVYFEIFKYFLN